MTCSVCGNIQKPGNYEVPMGFPFKDFLYDLCGGPPPGRKFKAIIPGGISVPIQTVAEAEASLMDYEGFVAQGTMLGSGGVNEKPLKSAYGLGGVPKRDRMHAHRPGSIDACLDIVEKDTAVRLDAQANAGDAIEARIGLEQSLLV